MADEADYDRMRGLLARTQPLRAHAMGVCGVGVSGVVHLLAGRGWTVSGCDTDAGGAPADSLRRLGLTVLAGHAPDHLDASCDLLIRSAAVSDRHPEVTRARELGIPVVRRGVLLAALLADAPGVAVCGTHGKTTTACFTLRLLQVLGADPDWCIGGHTVSMGGVARCGGAGPLVVEGDESDGTLAHYEAAVLVVTNVDADHLEHFGSLEALQACFAAAIDRARGVVFCADDPGAARLAARHPRALGYGFGPEARLRLTALRMEADRMTLAIACDGIPLGEATLPVTGRHNALNAAAALGAALMLGHAPAAAFAALAELKELPGRRFERLLRQDGVEIVSDYSHHPAEIAALVALARLQPARRVIALFQPHRYSRTLALGPDFPRAFTGVDELLLLPVYAASEAPLAGGDTADLYAHFRAQSPPQVPVPRLAGSLEAAAAWLLETLRAGDLLLVVGAGDVVKVGHAVAHAWRARARPKVERIAERLAAMRDVTVQRRVALASLTTLGVGGTADLLVDVGSEAGLAEVLRLCHEAGLACRLLGGGSNLLVGDLGVRGVVVRLSGGVFSNISVQADGRVTAGCGARGTALLNRLAEAGLDGLAFMDGIPGQVGGWVASNAGAHGGCIGDRVRAIRGLNSDGSTVIVDAETAGFGYRRCRALESAMAVQVELVLTPGDADGIAAARQAFRRKRLDFEGTRSAGSIFRNPAGDAAGRLLEAAGCKGMQIGGARVFERHANVIVTDGGATASDVIALIHRMRERVLAQQGVDLSAEVRIWQD